VLLLTARGEDVDRIVGLEIGADDYLPKPFNPRELLARVRAILRRSAGRKQVETGGSYLEAAGIAMDPGARTASCRGVALDLTDVEFELLHERGGVLGGRGVPDFEVRLGELEDTKTTVLVTPPVEIEAAGVFVVEPLNNPTHALLADVGDSLEAGLAS
jgi:hypothetical protein